MRKKKADRLAAAGGMGMLFAAGNAAEGQGVAGGPTMDEGGRSVREDNIFQL